MAIIFFSAWFGARICTDTLFFSLSPYLTAVIRPQWTREQSPCSEMYVALTFLATPVVLFLTSSPFPAVGSLLDVPTHTVNMVTARSQDDLWESYSMNPHEVSTLVLNLISL